MMKFVAVLLLTPTPLLSQDTTELPSFSNIQTLWELSGSPDASLSNIASAESTAFRYVDYFYIDERTQTADFEKSILATGIKLLPVAGFPTAGVTDPATVIEAAKENPSMVGIVPNLLTTWSSQPATDLSTTDLANALRYAGFNTDDPKATARSFAKFQSMRAGVVSGYADASSKEFINFMKISSGYSGEVIIDSSGVDKAFLEGIVKYQSFNPNDVAFSKALLSLYSAKPEIQNLALPAQVALYKSGMYRGAVDGVVTDELRQAIASYAAATGSLTDKAWHGYATSSLESIASAEFEVPYNLIPMSNVGLAIDRTSEYFEELATHPPQVDASLGKIETGWVKACKHTNQSTGCQSSYVATISRDLAQEGVLWLTFECGYQKYYALAGWKPFDAPDLVKPGCDGVRRELMLKLKG